jgi:DNA mismatch repair protein MutS
MILNQELLCLNLLEHAIIENPPMLIRAGGIFKNNYDVELDQLRSFNQDSKINLENLLYQEKIQHNLDNLKIGYNRVTGYYFELSKNKTTMIPTHFQRVQSLKNIERYSTAALKEYEIKALTANSKALTREKQLYVELLEKINIELIQIQEIAEALSELDVLLTFANNAKNNSFNLLLFFVQCLVV